MNAFAFKSVHGQKERLCRAVIGGFHTTSRHQLSRSWKNRSDQVEMSSDDYKRETGYYTFQSRPSHFLIHQFTHDVLVLRASGVGPDIKDLYAEVEVKDTIQRTQVIHDESALWKETLPM